MNEPHLWFVVVLCCVYQEGCCIGTMKWNAICVKWEVKSRECRLYPDSWNQVIRDQRTCRACQMMIIQDPKMLTSGWSEPAFCRVCTAALRESETGLWCPSITCFWIANEHFSDTAVVLIFHLSTLFPLFFSWSFLEVTTSSQYNDSIQAYAAGVVEAAVTSQVSFLLLPCAAEYVLFTGITCNVI